MQIDRSEACPFHCRCHEAADEIDRLNTIFRRETDLVVELREEIGRLLTALKECSDDLAAEIEARYHKTLDYPSQRIKYDRDMAPVVTARQLLNPEQKAEG